MCHELQEVEEETTVAAQDVEGLAAVGEEALVLHTGTRNRNRNRNRITSKGQGRDKGEKGCNTMKHELTRQ